MQSSMQDSVRMGGASMLQENIKTGNKDMPTIVKSEKSPECNQIKADLKTKSALACEY